MAAARVFRQKKRFKQLEGWEEGEQSSLKERGGGLAVTCTGAIKNRMSARKKRANFTKVQNRWKDSEHSPGKVFREKGVYFKERG